MERLNEVKGEAGLADNFVEEEPAIGVFWNVEEALGFVVEPLAGETDRDEGRELGLSLVFGLVVLGTREDREKEYDG